MKFNEYPWHDAVVKSIHIDRSNSGYKDFILLEVVWPDDSCSSVIFQEVYFARLSMNFGIVAPEAILAAFEAPADDPELVKVRRTWRL